MTLTEPRFALLSRILHWTMAPLIVAMLLIGVGMVASLADYHWLVAIHKPLGIAILALVAIRFVNRLFNPPPKLPTAMPAWQCFLARASHVVLYALMFALPLVGWGMLSAARYPVVLYGSIELPPILPASVTLYAALRDLHTTLAFLLFATILLHIGAALTHALIFRDGVFESMASARAPVAEPPAAEEKAPAASSS